MDFSVEFYETPGGGSPVEEFLEELRRTDPGDHRAVLAGLAKLRERQNHHEPLCKMLGGGLLELRHVGKLNTRVIWFFRKGRRIIVVHAIRNKGQKIAASDMQVALKRKADWNARYPG